MVTLARLAPLAPELTYYDQRKGQPLNVKIAAQPTTKSEPLVELSKPENSKEIPQAAPASVEEEVLKSVPKVYKTGPRQLLDKIKENRNVLHWNDKGELIYENKAIPGSHLVDLINDALRHRNGFEPVAWPVFARGLARMNVPRKLGSYSSKTECHSRV